MYESIRDLEIKISMLFDLVLANNTILLCLFFLFLIIDFYFSNPAGIAQIFNSIAEFIITIGKPSKKAKAEIGIHPVTAIKIQ